MHYIVPFYSSLLKNNWINIQLMSTVLYNKALFSFICISAVGGPVTIREGSITLTPAVTPNPNGLRA